jgi:ADP-heptose:LPS heptosyltransferase
LTDALAVVAAAGQLVSVDGGIMHAAVAMGVPTVALFGPTDPGAWFPYERLGPYRVLATRPHCHPCGLHACDAFICLPDLDPATVAATVLDGEVRT